MFGLISKKKIIKVFSEQLAERQKKSDYWYYIRNNQEMSSYVLENLGEIKSLATKLGIVKDVYNEAYKIYDFRNSGKKDFAPIWSELKKLEQN